MKIFFDHHKFIVAGGRYSQLEMKFTTITQELSQSKETIRTLNVTINELKTNLQREIQIKVDIQRKYEEISMQFTKIKVFMGVK